LLPARRQPFVCLAGRQVEEIELAFAEGVPLPQKIDGRRIENRNFVYTSDYQLEGRALKVRREFVSRVPLRDVFASNAVRMAYAGQPAQELAEAAPSNSPSMAKRTSGRTGHSPTLRGKIRASSATSRRAT
jgi:hypothetical protein